LKQAVENHPILVTITAISLLINAGVGSVQAYRTFFGDKPLLVETYIDTSIGLAEYSGTPQASDFKPTGVLRPYGCRIADNELRRGYLATMLEQPSPQYPLAYEGGSIASVEDKVLYVVVRNEGSALARDVVLVGDRMKNPYEVEQGPAGEKKRTSASLEGLVGAWGHELKEDAPEPVRVSAGRLGPRECVAIPVAVYAHQPDENDGVQRLSRPVFRFHTVEYRRAFGWIRESNPIRPPDPTPLSVDPVTFERG
jgi:hypothetical protein